MEITVSKQVQAARRAKLREQQHEAEQVRINRDIEERGHLFAGWQLKQNVGIRCPLTSPEQPIACLRARCVNVVNGPTFGFGDEVVGAVGGALKTLVNDKSLSQNYRETRDYTRGIQDQYKEDFPIGSTVTQLAASAPTIALNPLGKAAGAGLGAVAPKLAAWMNLATTLSGVLPNTLRAAVSGAGYGAVIDTRRLVTHLH